MSPDRRKYKRNHFFLHEIKENLSFNNLRLIITESILYAPSDTKPNNIYSVVLSCIEQPHEVKNIAVLCR
jgi:hypothetical protein